MNEPTNEPTRILNEARSRRDWTLNLALNVTLDYIHGQDKNAEFKKYLEQWAVNDSPVGTDRHPISIMVDFRGREEWPEELALEMTLDFVDRHCAISSYKDYLQRMANYESQVSDQD